jgi:hypothetical protein
MQPFEVDLTAWRNAPYGGVGMEKDFVHLGENLSGSTLRLQIRTAPGNRIDALITLNAVGAPNTPGLYHQWSAGYLHPVTGATVGASIVTPFIADTALEALPWPPERDQPIVLHYDYLVTPAGGIERVECFGKFTLYPGVTLS